MGEELKENRSISGGNEAGVIPDDDMEDNVFTHGPMFMEKTLPCCQSTCVQVTLFSFATLAISATLLGALAFGPHKFRGISNELWDHLGDPDWLFNHQVETVTEGISEKPLPPLPPLGDLLNGTEVVGDVSWMLDFSIVDFPKGGTTFLMNYLRRHSKETYVHRGEICVLDKKHPDNLVRQYYQPQVENRRTSDGQRIKFGIKCPEELETEFGLRMYTEYFPKTDFIVTVRHPVLWFQSYYNFRAYKRYPLRMPPAKDLIGSCVPGYPYVMYNCSAHCPSHKQNVCTARANFHHALSRLGKTPRSTPEEAALLRHGMEVLRPPASNRVFLLENRQIVMENEASRHLPRDLSRFLGLRDELPPLKPYTPRPDKHADEAAAATMIDICEEEHGEVRAALVRQGEEAARWIRDYFIQSRDVVVSYREEFVKLLDDWGQDPCDDRENRALWAEEGMSW